MKRAAAEGQRRRAQEGKAAPPVDGGRPEPKRGGHPEHIAPLLLGVLAETARKVRSRKRR